MADKTSWEKRRVGTRAKMDEKLDAIGDVLGTIGKRALLLIGAALLFCGCSSGQLIVQESSIPPGLYVGDRTCTTRANGEEDLSVDSSSLTIDNDGLAVINGETIHVGLVNVFESGAATQRSVIEAIAVSADGFTIDWDETFVINGVSLDGFSDETFKAVGPNTLEIRTDTLLSTEGVIVTIDCVAILSR